jgi:calcium-dependent protein kinase
MGNCCARQEVVELESARSTSGSSHRNSSILFEKFSKQTDYKKKYEYIQMLGCGAFGKVRLYVDRQCKSFRYAIKTLKKDYFNKHILDSIEREVDILRSLDHPNIVKYFETYEDDHFIHIVMEYIPGDNLFKLITNKKYFKFTEKEICQLITCLLKAVLFLHHNNIVHRDIKPENILFSVPGDFNALKLIDFGLSIQKNAKNENRRVGTPYYMSPEMIHGNFVYESDVWSIGVILFIMVTGKQPFRAHDKEGVFEKILNGKYDKKSLEKSKCSIELKDLIKKTLVKDYKKRISVESALQHKWFSLFEDNKNNFQVIDQDILDSLQNFQYTNILQKETFYYLAKLSNDKEILKLKKAFEIIDKDNSGEIEYEEIPKIFEDLGIQASEQELKNIFNSLDFHCDGKVNYSEFLAGTISSLKIYKDDKLFSAFKYFDVNDEGYITSESILSALKASNVAVDEISLIDYFNKRKLKKINFEQFKTLVLAKNFEEEKIKRFRSKSINIEGRYY